MIEIFISIEEKTIFGTNTTLDTKYFLTEAKRDAYIEKLSNELYRNEKFREYKKNCFDDGMKINVNFKKRKQLVEDLNSITYEE